MATIDLASEGVAGLHPSKTGTKGGYLVRYLINLADAVTAKGSALAQADVIQLIPVPTNTLIVDAGIYCKTAMTGTSTDATIDFGLTGVDVDQFVDGWDLDAAVAGDFAAPRGVGLGRIVGGTADTIDALIVTQTGTILTGEWVAWAYLVDLANVPAVEPGIAQPGS